MLIVDFSKQGDVRSVLAEAFGFPIKVVEGNLIF